MKTESQLESIFFAALEKPSSALRAAFLDEACAGNDELRGRVEKMLVAQSDAGNFLEQPALARDATTDREPAIAEHPGAVIGPYKLRESLGEGGMGVVYVAEQETPVRRKVALKVIKPGMDSRQVMARFEAERQSLSLMDHPHIARVLDAGTTESGRPYFVMELVRGVPITDFCDQRRLGPRQRLEIFVQVCRAIQHAHQKGIIHRDVKPTNVLVTLHDELAVPKVIDFGIAKATGQRLTEQSVYTAFSQLIGTPLYMSPEQAEMNALDVDTRSDVYSLGVLLYELLTGKTPFDADALRQAGFDEMRRLIREVDPPRPSERVSTLDAQAASTIAQSRGVDERRLAVALRGDLDWIIMKALEKDRVRRYESASALAADVQRYLDDEAVEACPPTRRYRLGKFVSRHRVALLTTSMVVAALLLGFGVSVWQAVRATRADQTKAVALQQARRAVDEMYTEVAEEWLRNHGSLSTVQRGFLENALAFYENFSEQLGDVPEVRYAALRSLDRVGRIRDRLGNNADATEAYLRAIDESAKLMGRHPDRPEFRVENIFARAQLAQIYRNIDRADESNEQLVQAYDEVSLLKSEALRTTDHRRRSASALAALSAQLTTAGRRDEAKVAIEKAIDAWRSLVEDNPAEYKNRHGLAHAFYVQGMRQMWWGSTDGEAEVAFRDAESLLKTLVEERPADVASRILMDSTLTNLGVVLHRQRRHAEAVDVERRAVLIGEELADEFPNDSYIQHGYAMSLANLAASLDDGKLGEAGEAERLRLKGHEVLAKLVTSYPDEIKFATSYLDSVIKITRALYTQGDNDVTQQFHEHAAPILKTIVEAHSGNDAVMSRVGVCMTKQAAIYVERGDHAQAAQVISNYPPRISAFQSEFVLPFKLDADERARQKRANYESQVLLLMTPAALLGECASLAEQDEALSPDEQMKASEACAAQAKVFRGEADIAIDAWVREILASPEDMEYRAALQGDGLLQTVQGYERDTGIPACLRSAYIDANAILFHELVKRAASALSDDAEQHFIAALLSTAPPELRDVDLSLSLARRGTELAPNDPMAQQSLGWALYRSNEYQACLETLTNMKDVSDDGPRSVMTMALWRLGQREKAREIFGGDQHRLDAYIKSCKEKSAQGWVVFPTPDMLKRLHNEAAIMLSEIDSPNSFASPPLPIPLAN